MPISTRGLTAQARSVIAAAELEAHSLNEGNPGPEHLLLALARADSSLAATTLDRLGVDRQRLASEMLRHLASEQRVRARAKTMKDCVQRAGDLARAGRHSLIGTEHLLLAAIELASVEAGSDGMAAVPSANELTFGRIDAEISSLLT
jgi:ATP-dependent Clp protease ATP-binding subunit ClpA